MFDNADRRREVFGKLAHRLQSLVNRAIQGIDGLEREIEDPEQLRGLYEVDHLVVRVRRQAENLAVLGGGAPQRRSSEPVSVYAVMRAAVAEIEHYKQVTIAPYSGPNVHGHAVAEVIHLLAELLENATTFAPDAQKVMLRAEKVTAGLAIEVQDRGLGMAQADLERRNRVLDGSAAIDLAHLLQDGRIGLAVVKELSRRHNVRVQLQTNIFGGTDAIVVLPNGLLVDPRPESGTSHVPQPVAQDPPQAAPAPVTPAAATQVPATAAPAMPAPVAQAPAMSAPVGQAPAMSAPATPAAGMQVPATQAPAAQPLPVRTPGTAITAVRQTRTEPSDTDPPEDLGRPPLPQRRGSHLHPELRDSPATTTPLLGHHNPNLMSSIQQGSDRVRREAAAAAEPPHGTVQGDSWPTI